MWTRQCLFLLQRFNVVSPVLVPQNDSKMPKNLLQCFNHFCSSDFYFIFSPADITQYTLRERKAPSTSTFWCLRNPLFSENILNGSLLSSGLTTKAIPTLALYPVFRIEWPTQFREALTIQFRSQLALESSGLCSPKGWLFIPTYTLPPFPLPSPLSKGLCYEGPGHTQRILQE